MVIKQKGNSFSGKYGLDKFVEPYANIHFDPYHFVCGALNSEI